MTGTEWYQAECEKVLPGSKFEGKVRDCGIACWACKKMAGCCMPQPVKDCGNPHNNRGFWNFVGYTNGKRKISYTSGRSSTDSHERTKSWETSVGISIEKNLVFKGTKGSTTLSTKHSRGVTHLLSHALEKSKSMKVTRKFVKPGAVWQWTFETKDQCGTSVLRTKNLVQTAHRGKPPCCLPGWALDKTEQNCWAHSINICTAKAPKTPAWGKRRSPPRRHPRSHPRRRHPRSHPRRRHPRRHRHRRHRRG